MCREGALQCVSDKEVIFNSNEYNHGSLWIRSKQYYRNLILQGPSQSLWRLRCRAGVFGVWSDLPLKRRERIARSRELEAQSYSELGPPLYLVIFFTNTTTNRAMVKLPVNASIAAMARENPIGVKSPYPRVVKVTTE